MPVGLYYADFLCRSLNLVVELDGFSHNMAQQQDAARDRWMKQHGYTVLRFSNHDVHTNIEGVVTVIAQEIARLRAFQTHP